jgi:nucleoporin SEH1
MAGSELVETGHNDRVTVVHSNFDGTKLLTGSIDHRIKVWEVDPKTKERKLLDTFTAHDADIKDVSYP